MTQPARTGPPARNRQRGFALLIVLWTLGLLALLVTHLSASARAQIRLAETARDSAAAEAAADGAIQHAIFALQDGSWRPGSAAQRLGIGRAMVGVAIEDRSFMLNPNYAPPPLIAALLRQGGVDAARAQSIGLHVMEWHTGSTHTMNGKPKDAEYRTAGLPYGPTNRFFTADDDVALVLGVTPQAMALLRPYLSVYQAGDPSLAASFGTTSGLVQEAETAGRQGVLVGFNSPYRIIRVTATASVARGARFTRTALVRLPLQPGEGRAPALIISWD